MSDLINGRTPEEIKRWVDGRATCNTCPKGNEVGCEYGERTNDCQMSIDTIAYIERLESERDAALSKVPKWISVEERLPEQNGIYLAHVVHRYCKIDSYWRVCIEYFGIEGTWDSLADIYEVTHWMPLPEPPKEEPNA